MYRKFYGQKYYWWCWCTTEFLNKMHCEFYVQSNCLVKKYIDKHNPSSSSSCVISYLVIIIHTTLNDDDYWLTTWRVRCYKRNACLYKNIYEMEKKEF